MRESWPGFDLKENASIARTTEEIDDGEALVYCRTYFDPFHGLKNGDLVIVSAVPIAHGWAYKTDYGTVEGAYVYGIEWHRLFQST